MHHLSEAAAAFGPLPSTAQRHRFQATKCEGGVLQLLYSSGVPLAATAANCSCFRCCWHNEALDGLPNELSQAKAVWGGLAALSIAAAAVNLNLLLLQQPPLYEWRYGKRQGLM